MQGETSASFLCHGVWGEKKKKTRHSASGAGDLAPGVQRVGAALPGAPVPGPVDPALRARGVVQHLMELGTGYLGT